MNSVVSRIQDSVLSVDFRLMKNIALETQV